MSILLLANIAVSVALVYVSMVAYKEVKLKVFKDAFFIFMIASYIWLAANMTVYLGLKDLLFNDFVLKIFITCFTTFLIVLSFGIFRLANAITALGMGTKS